MAAVVVGQKETHTVERNNLSINDSCGCCGGWAEGNPHYGKKTFINLKTWDLVTAREWAVSKKGLINYCRLDKTGSHCTARSSSGCADWLPGSIFPVLPN